MLSELHLIFGIALVLSWICGTVLNSSIVAVYLSDWKKGLNLGACNQIILTMGCTNLLLQSFLTFHLMFIIYQFSVLLDKELLLAAVSFGLHFSVSLSIWLTAWLSGCYCVRLFNSSNRFFIRLKREVSTVVAYCLLGTVLTLFITEMPIIWTTHITTDQNQTSIYSMMDDNIALVLFNVAISCLLPTIITSFCIGLSLMSLLKHVHKMKQNSSKFWNPQLKSHVKACRTMLLLLAVNLIFSLTVFISSQLKDKAGVSGIYVPWFILMSNPSGKAIILLFGNSRLATAWSKFLFSQ
ncbi:hypothetical protein XENTR_v10023622 [Xenopus tropicalis]|nr:hypothetical protein XENTR_v10023622 [Xenopus tropicalis]